MSTKWTPEQLALLRELYPHNKTEIVAIELNRSLSGCYRMAAKLGFNKSAAYLASPDACRLRREGEIGKNYRFKKSHDTWNKGVKGINCPGCRATQFKKGVRQGVAIKLYQPISSERISKNGYLQRKVNDDLPLQRRWRGVHIILWEAQNGPLPKGHAIVFRNGDKKDVRLDNLELVTRAELMRRNSFHNNYPKEVGKLILLRGALNRKINRRLKDDNPT